ncbi:MAG: tRNA 2-thiocytidine(32) synthetase TtcA [Prochlorothrix sp.]
MTSSASQPWTSPSKEQQRWAKRLRHQMGRAIADYGLIEAGDRIMVCVSGGKDSHVLLDLLLQLQHRAPIPFQILAVNLDQKQPGFPADRLPHYFQTRQIPYRIVEEDTYSRVIAKTAPGDTYCSLCSRFRRAILYRVAQAENITKLALGHHRDDAVETLFLNLFHTGQLKAMPPKLHSDNGQNIVIRPLIYCSEADIAHYATLCQFPIVPCTLCGSQENLQRAQIKALLQTWEQEHPGRTETIFRSLQNVVPSHLADRQLWDPLNRASAP